MERGRFNVIGAGFTLGSVVVPWYMAYLCQLFVAYWLFNLPHPSWPVLIAVIGGGVVSLFSRYGGIITIVASLFFAMTFDTSQLVTATYTGQNPFVVNSFICQRTSNFYQVNEPTLTHIVGFYVALAGGVITLVAGASWTLPSRFKWRILPLHIGLPKGERNVAAEQSSSNMR